MARGSYEDHLMTELRHSAPSLQLKRLKVTLFNGPDKRDPLNVRAVMTAEAEVEGKPCAWIIEGMNGDPAAAAAMCLLKELAAFITSTPNQTRASAAANVKKID